MIHCEGDFEDRQGRPMALCGAKRRDIKAPDNMIPWYKFEITNLPKCQKCVEANEALNKEYS